MKTCVSLASWPGTRVAQAVQRLREKITEPLLGDLSIEHVQLVPQSFGRLTDDLVDSLTTAFPLTRFRLHANVRVLANHRFADLSTFNADRDWFVQAAGISRLLKAPAYTAHAGRRVNATFEQLLDNARRCTDMFGCPVGVEGLYPATGNPWLVSTWHEYQALLVADVPYAIDLSHLHILACQSGVRNEDLVRELLASERCIEVHLSHNDGRGDQHQVCNSEPWWYSLLNSIHPLAVVFSEGNHRHKGKPHDHEQAL